MLWWLHDLVSSAELVDQVGGFAAIRGEPAAALLAERRGDRIDLFDGDGRLTLHLTMEAARYRAVIGALGQSCVTKQCRIGLALQEAVELRGARQHMRKFRHG